MSSLKFKDTNGEWKKIVGGANVAAFNGRIGSVKPQVGDYTAEMVGADEAGSAASALEEAKAYADEKVLNISNEFSSSTAQVGDLMSSIRTDLDDTWLLCNGDEIPVNEYGKFAEKYSDIVPGLWAIKDLWTGDPTSTSSSNVDGNISYCITYADGYWVVGGGGQDGSTYSARIAYTTDPTGEWTTKVLWSSGHLVRNAINCITYANGYWVAGGSYYDGTTWRSRIAYTTDPTGEWTIKNLWSGSDKNMIYCITYANGYWVVGGSQYDSTRYSYVAKIAYTTDFTGTWTTKDLSSIESVNCIAYANDYWVVGDDSRRIAYTTDLIGEWITKGLWSDSSGSNNINCITYADGYWVVGGRYYDGTNYYARIAYTTDPTGEWTTKDLWYQNRSEIAINCIMYIDGYWVVGGQYYGQDNSYARIARTKNITTEQWVFKNVYNNSEKVRCITYANDYLIIGGKTHSRFARIAYTNNLYCFTLPTITQDNAYVYIKAKEE